MYDNRLYIIDYRQMLHDIRIDSRIRNTIIIDTDNNIHDDNKILISGDIVFSLNEDTLIKDIDIRLNTHYNINYIETFQTKDGMKICECPFKESTLLNSYKSHPLFKVNSNNTPTLLLYKRGNHSIRFTISVPFDELLESVECLKYASIVHSLQSKIVFSDDSISTSTSFKHLIIIKKPSQLLLSSHCNEYLAENSWINKINYKIRLPSTYIPLNSNLKIYFLLQPLLKNIKLGKITIQIAQLIKFNTFNNNNFDESTFTDEKIIFQSNLPYVNNDYLPNDFWALKANIPLPNNLRKLPHDINNKLINVKHRLIIFIEFLNPDGHISQIKSKLPINFFIDPNLPLLYNKPIISNRETNFSNNLTPMFDKLPSIIQSQSQSELIVSSCDELNPDSFLFNDEYLNIIEPSDEIEIPITSLKDIPPTYNDRLKDPIFELRSNSPNIQVPPTPPVSMVSLVSYNNNNKVSDNNTTNTPDYSKIYDLPTENIEPSPLYHHKPTATLIPTPTTSLIRITDRILKRPHSPLPISL